MCGHCGIILGKPAGADAARAIAERMTASIVHRGPDDVGLWEECAVGIGFGFRRLSIIDLSAAGHQPMMTSDQRVSLVMNGEIYNYKELRRELGERAWRGHSDTEVLLTGFAEWGVRKTLERTNGMFSLAVWDTGTRTLSLAVDRLGEKPLYYGVVGGDFVFGSELKALRQHPRWHGEIDRDALGAYFKTGYVPAPLSIYRGIRKLEPGSVLTVTRDDSGGFIMRAERYWSAADAVRAGMRDPFTGSDQEAVDALEKLLGDAVEMRMEADVPLGSFLSGGLDSSTLTALMQARSSRPVRTFSIGFSQTGYDEAVYAKKIAAHLGTEHTEHYVGEKELLDVVPMLPRIYDEPFADSSQIPTYLVSGIARRHVTVAISGDGGDELFAGYNRYLWGRRLLRARGVPGWARASLAAAMHGVPIRTWDRTYAALKPLVPSRFRVMRAGESMHKLASTIHASNVSELYDRLSSHWPAPGEVVRGMSPNGHASVDVPQTADGVHWMMYRDLIGYLPGDLLVKLDRASMAVSLEGRVPFLDHRVVELAWRMPLRMKLRNGTSKWILRQILARHVPTELFERPKVGFGVPLAAWLRGPLRAWAEDLLDERALATEGYLEPKTVRALWDEHQGGARDWHTELWDVLMFQAWLRAGI